MNLGQQPAGTVVEVIMQGGEAFVEVLDDQNLGLLTSGQVHTYFGGPISGTFQCTLPTTGIWYVLGIATAGPTQAQIFTTAPTPNGARLPWAQDAQPIELQSGEVPDGTATAVDEPVNPSPPSAPAPAAPNPVHLSSQFVAIVVGRNADPRAGAEMAGLHAVDELVPMGADSGSESTSFYTGDGLRADGSPRGRGALAPYTGAISWPESGDQPVIIGGPIIDRALSPTTTGSERILAISSFQMNGRNLLFGHDTVGGGDKFKTLATRALDPISKETLLTLGGQFTNLSATQDPDTGTIYVVGAMGKQKKIWRFTPEEFVVPSNWDNDSHVIGEFEGTDSETKIARLVNPATGLPFWAIFESRNAADNQQGLTYRTAATPEAFMAPGSSVHMLLANGSDNNTLYDDGPDFGMNPHGLPDTEARPGLPGIPMQEGWLPANYGVAVHQLPNGDIVLLTSQWVKPPGDGDIGRNLYREVQYRINIS